MSEGRNATHQIKKMTADQLRLLRERLHLQDEVPEDALADDKEPPYIQLREDSEIRQYMLDRRLALDGSLPAPGGAHEAQARAPGQGGLRRGARRLGQAGGVHHHRVHAAPAQPLPRSAVRPRVVPIIPDEARTFGMDSLFKEFGIYASQGQMYEPVDHALLLSYKESQQGQILEEGITEAGALASFIAAGTSYATQGVPMVPFFTFYSMFGWQRVGDLIWQATDARARGFLLGATAGRTTLLGEGLQHQDGHSLLLASVNPFAEAFDPAFAYEVATIVRHGLRACGSRTKTSSTTSRSTTRTR
jgi:pyruvate dehydrogenase E1 component